jgi:pyruvate,water dikinase
LAASGLIITLNNISRYGPQVVGGKAANIGRLINMGAAVPAGFCITATAMQEQFEASKLSTKISALLKELNNGPAEEICGKLAEIRNCITNMKINAELELEIGEQFKTLGYSAAVRSSATIEDLPGHSFAGMYETVLGATNARECIAAVKKCWASLWTERAYDYRQKNGIDQSNIAMAVIVQELVQAESSGVIFTRDPVRGYESRIVIEACTGLGQAIVSGAVRPERFNIRKRGFKITFHELPENKIEYAADRSGRVIEKQVEAERQRARCLEDRTARKLAKQALKIEQKFGCAQDIEWAISNGKIYFLQARPITTAVKEKTWAEKQIWSNVNAGEVAPDVMTPMTWSVVEQFVTGLFDPLLVFFKPKPSASQLFGMVCGRVYFNINTLIAIGKTIPKTKIDPSLIFGGQDSSDVEIDVPDECLPDIRLNWMNLIFKLPVLIFKSAIATPARLELFIAKLARRADELYAADFGGMSDREIAERFNLAMSQVNEFDFAAFMARGMIEFVLFNSVCRRWIKGVNARSLFSGLSGIESAESGFELGELAVRAEKSAGIKRILLKGDNWASTREQLTNLTEGKEFIEAWDSFMRRYGHHCRGEVELSNPRWSEEPDYILKTIQSYVKANEIRDVMISRERLEFARRQVAQECKRQLRNPFKRILFFKLLKSSQSASRFRENWKNQIVRSVGGLRAIAMEMGRRFEKRGKLEKSEDIFFLRNDELRPAAEGMELKERIANRRAEYEKNKSIMPPKVVIGEFDPANFKAEGFRGDTRILRGIGVSAGEATGRARVIMREDPNERLLAGEILVAPFTDPGWTPYFIPAAGIVLDQGGILSHGSIIAREYGIPAVANTGVATKVIKTGQMISVDADRGTVSILE